MSGTTAKQHSLISGRTPIEDSAKSLFVHLADVRRQISRTIWMFGLGRFITVFVSSLLLCGFIDWLLHVDDAGIRVVLTLAIIIGSGWVAWKYLFRPLTSKLTDVDVARQLERCHRGLNDRLSSSIQFLTQAGDPSIGSLDLQTVVVEQTVGRLQNVDTASVVDTRPAKRSATVAGFAAMTLLAVLLLSPGTALTAMKRLAMPFANLPWPKQTVLQFVNEQGQPLGIDSRKPWQLAEGESLELLVRNTAGDLPEDARIQIQVGEKKKLYVRSVRPSTVTDDSGERVDVGVTSLSLHNSLRFRAIGGDDEGTPWQAVRVIPVPILEDLTVSVQPPQYTQRPARKQATTSQFSILCGSEISIRAHSNKPLRKAVLVVGDASPVELAIAKTNQIATAFLPDTPGPLSWQIVLTDTDGFQNPSPRRYELIVQADQVPDVYIDRPAQDLRVTATASVPVNVVAKDDLGVRDVSLHYRTGLSEDSEIQSIMLKQDHERPELASTEYVWNLAELNATPGDRIVFHAEATDDFDLGDPHVGRSVPRTLIVVSPADKQQELATQQTELMSDLERIADLQTRTHDQTRELQVQLEQAGELQDDDVDLLKRVEVEQRRITSRLFAADEGLESQSQRLLDEMTANGLNESENRRQLEQLNEGLKRIREDMTPVIENEITRARKSADSNNGQGDDSDKSTSQNESSKQTQDALAAAAEKQQQVVEALQQSLDELSIWKQRFDIVGDLNRVISEQEELNRDTTAASGETLTQSLNQLTPQQKADLARLAERQRRQAREMRALTDALTKAAEQLQGALKDSVKETSDELSQKSPALTMESAADRIAANQLGGATQQQSEVLNQLTQARETLNNQSIDDSETMVKNLKQREAELNALRDRQEEMVKQLNDAPAVADGDRLEKLRREQQQLQEQTEAAAEKLRRNSARRAARSSDRAAERMRQAEESMGQQSQSPNESQKEETKQLASEALEDLEQALDETAEQREQAESELAQETMYQLADALTGLLTQQQSVIDETIRLEALRQQAGRLTRSQSKSVLNLADVQRRILEEVTHLADSVSEAKVVAFTLSSATKEMQRAADLLSQRKTGVATTTAERSGLKRLRNLLSVLKQEQQAKQQAENTQPREPQDGQQKTQSGPPQESISLIAQLTLLRSLQQGLLDRTAELEVQRASGEEFNDQGQTEIDYIAKEQIELADLAEMLAAEAANDTVDAPGTPESDTGEITIEEGLVPELELQR